MPLPPCLLSPQSLAFALPERQPCPELHDGSELLLDMLGTSELWPFAYLRWEQAVLEHTGYGLDLSQCAVTGQTEHLIYVSRTGRAVSAEGERALGRTGCCCPLASRGSPLRIAQNCWRHYGPRPFLASPPGRCPGQQTASGGARQAGGAAEYTGENARHKGIGAPHAKDAPE